MLVGWQRSWSSLGDIAPAAPVSLDRASSWQSSLTPGHDTQQSCTAQSRAQLSSQDCVISTQRRAACCCGYTCLTFGSERLPSADCAWGQGQAEPLGEEHNPLQLFGAMSHAEDRPEAEQGLNNEDRAGRSAAAVTPLQGSRGARQPSWFLDASDAEAGRAAQRCTACQLACCRAAGQQRPCLLDLRDNTVWPALQPPVLPAPACQALAPSAPAQHWDLHNLSSAHHPPCTGTPVGARLSSWAERACPQSLPASSAAPSAPQPAPQAQQPPPPQSPVKAAQPLSTAAGSRGEGPLGGPAKPGSRSQAPGTLDLQEEFSLAALGLGPAVGQHDGLQARHPQVQARTRILHALLPVGRCA